MKTDTLNRLSGYNKNCENVTICSAYTSKMESSQRRLSGLIFLIFLSPKITKNHQNIFIFYFSNILLTGVVLRSIIFRKRLDITLENLHLCFDMCGFV